MSPTNQLTFREIAPFFVDCIQALGCNPQDIKKSDLDIQCRCPVCGDSRTRKNLKRLHLYQKGDVINVNCFNGDCNVKNLTPYNFFRLYNNRIFEQFKQFYKRRFFNEFQDSVKSKEPKNAKLESLTSTEDELFEVNKVQLDPEIQSFVLGQVAEFRWSYNDVENMVNFTELVQTIKSRGDEAFQYFKSLVY